ncbi:LPP20 family lipoprotein [Neptunomonas japonica]|uniref:LPP20 family lipoprotein n=1 Tax=Neptunomonas japonica TaxID=417574 RepID=UPI00041B7DD8|nr:LPP20 family lipoprotein [Neptunomonas japonica]
MRLLFVVIVAALLSGCETAWITANEVVDKLPAPTIENDTSKSGAADWVQATGYAPISLQPGATRQQKVVMAMRASKLRAYQELVGVVHGQYIFGTTTVQDMVMQRDSFKAAVAGFVRGARVVKTYPIQDDTYATILEVDMSQLQRAWIN